MQQSDSLIVRQNLSVTADSGVKVQKVSKPKTVAEVLSRLPANATPEQQDSAVQANFQPKTRIYNTRPDTIGITPGTRIKESEILSNIVNYRNPYLFTDTLNYSEKNNDRFGVAADPVPYTIASDDVITGLLVGSFLLAIVAISNARRFITRQIKTFFHIINNNDRLTTTLQETTNEIRFQVFLVVVACLLLSTFYFLYTLENVADTFILPSQYHMLIIYFSVFAFYFIARFLLYESVNWVFFDPVRRRIWNKSQLFLAALVGISLFPFVMAITYFGMSAKTGLVYILVIVSVYELLTLFKCYLIFFLHRGGFLQIILYFCALEIAPLAILLGALIEINNLLKITY